MKLTNKITKTLRESTMGDPMGNDKTITVNSDENSVDAATATAEKISAKGSANVELNIEEGEEVLDENIGDDLESASRGADAGEVGEEDHEEQQEVLATMNEGKWTNIMKGVRQAPQPPFTIVAIQNGKVVDQQIGIDIADAIPAHYEAMKRKYPEARISIENGEGRSVFNEGLNVAAKMTKGNLERLIEAKVKPKRRIIKVGELKKK